MASRTRPGAPPPLYLRGEHERGDLADDAAGFRAAGLTGLRCARIPGAGHFAQVESPGQTWRAIAEFAGL